MCCMRLDIYYIDAFSSNLFSGNPAAVIFSDLDDEVLMQNIAAENNLSETAFINTNQNGNHIRWFSPTTEVNLCGHATLASAYAYFNYISPDETSISFQSASGELKVSRTDEVYELDFPKDNFNITDAVDEVRSATGIEPLETYLGDINMFAVFENEKAIENMNPDFNKVANLEGQGLIVSSRSIDYDFVSRYFCPKYGINEDPVTGSAHTTLIPYWSEKLGKTSMIAKQISKRGGELFCKNSTTRVFIGGKAKLYMKGEIKID